MCCAAFYDHINTGAAAALIFAGADITATDNTGYSPHCFGSVQPAGANGGGRAQAHGGGYGPYIAAVHRGRSHGQAQALAHGGGYDP
jgi:hypothetical protein